MYNNVTADTDDISIDDEFIKNEDIVTRNKIEHAFATKNANKPLNDGYDWLYQESEI